jgi:ABC-2 type transport system permease protein
MKLRHGSIVTIILSVACTILFIIFSFSLTPTQEMDLEFLGDVIATFASTAYPPAEYFQSALVMSDWSAVLMFALISILPVFLLMAVLGASFGKINSALFSRRTLRNFRLGNLRESSAFAALYRKELSRIFTSAVYFLNTVIGAILLVVFAIAIGFVDMEAIQAKSAIPLSGEIMPLLVCVFIGLSAITSVSLNLEGKSRWLPFSLPIESRVFFNAKIAMCMTMHLPPILISAPLLAMTFKTDLAITILLFILPVSCSYFIAVLGLFVNLKFPRYDWSSEYYAVKQSASSLVTLGIAIPFICLPLISIFILGTSNIPTVIIFGCIMLFSAYALHLRLNQTRLFM